MELGRKQLASACLLVATAAATSCELPDDTREGMLPGSLAQAAELATDNNFNYTRLTHGVYSEYATKKIGETTLHFATISDISKDDPADDQIEAAFMPESVLAVADYFQDIAAAKPEVTLPLVEQGGQAVPVTVSLQPQGAQDRYFLTAPRGAVTGMIAGSTPAAAQTFLSAKAELPSFSVLPPKPSAEASTLEEQLAHRIYEQVEVCQQAIRVGVTDDPSDTIDDSLAQEGVCHLLGESVGVLAHARDLATMQGQPLQAVDPASIYRGNVQHPQNRYLVTGVGGQGTNLRRMTLSDVGFQAVIARQVPWLESDTVTQ